MAESDLDRLIDELTALHGTTGDEAPAADEPVAASAPQAGDVTPGRTTLVGADTSLLEAWLREVVRRGGSDLLLVAQAPPSARVDKRVVAIGETVLTGPAIEHAVLPAVPPHAREVYARDGIADASFGVAGLVPGAD